MKKTPANLHRIRDVVLDLADAFGKRFTTGSALDLYSESVLDIVRDIPFDTHRKYGLINDIEWLKKEILQNCERFPTIKEIREIYEVCLVPYDELAMRGIPLDDIPLTREQRREKERAAYLEQFPDAEGEM